MIPEVIAEGRRLEQAVRDAGPNTSGWAQEMLRQWAGAHVSDLLDAAERAQRAEDLACDEQNNSAGLEDLVAALRVATEKAERERDDLRSVIAEIATQRGCDDDELIANPSLASPYEGEDDPLTVSLLSQVACAERERDAVLAVLVEVEWCQRVVMHESRFCPWCGRNSEHPHADDCALDQALRLLRDAANKLDVLRARHIMLQRIETLMGEMEEWSEDSEEDLHDAIMRTLDERAARTRKAEDALARARAKLQFTETVTLERDHAQLVEVPDALQRAEQAEQRLKKVELAIASFGVERARERDAFITRYNECVSALDAMADERSAAIARAQKAEHERNDEKITVARLNRDFMNAITRAEKAEEALRRSK